MTGTGTLDRLAGVIERSRDERLNVIIGERVENALAFAATPHEARSVEDAQLLRYGRKTRAARGCELGDAALAALETMQEAQPREIARRTKERGGALEVLLRGRDVAFRPVPAARSAVRR